jgi:hypothetical protein
MTSTTTGLRSDLNILEEENSNSGQQQEQAIIISEGRPQQTTLLPLEPRTPLPLPLPGTEDEAAIQALTQDLQDI